MNYYEYVGTTRAAIEQYIADGLLTIQHHNTFPLDILCYGRMAVHENLWDRVTTRTRGIIIHRETGEVIARPFEKFFNFSLTDEPSMKEIETLNQQGLKPYLWEKMDGFILTRYEWEGKSYLASKSSFHSVHAKWGTAELRKTTDMWWPEGYTAVFEGITPGLRIVVDYGERSELVLLALIHTETGAEMEPAELRFVAANNGLRVPVLEQSQEVESFYHSTVTNNVQNFEGYVATWYREGKTPFRLKLKYTEYLRLHRLVTGVSPKRIAQYLREGWTAEMDELINRSTPWMRAFVEKWKYALETRYNEIETLTENEFDIVRDIVAEQIKDGRIDPLDPKAVRKAFAAEFTAEGNKKYSGILFALLDKADVSGYIWEMVQREMTVGKRPLRSDFE